MKKKIPLIFSVLFIFFFSYIALPAQNASATVAECPNYILDKNACEDDCKVPCVEGPAAGLWCCPAGKVGKPSPPCPAGAICIENPLEAGNIPQLIDNILRFLVVVASIAAPIMIIISGLLFVTAAGDPMKVTTAKKMLIYTVVGFAIILLGRGLVSLIRGILGG
jgi:hypothetical protein